MGQIFAHYTCTRVMWEYDEDDFPVSDSPIEEHGWVDRRWSTTELYDNRNDVSPVISLDESDPGLADEVRDAVRWLEGGAEEECYPGRFYAKELYQPYTEPWSYSYAIHFTRKFHGERGWMEEPWSPVKDGGIKL